MTERTVETLQRIEPKLTIGSAVPRRIGASVLKYSDVRDINKEQITETMKPVVDLLREIGATEWFEWLNEAYRRASGQGGSAIEWLDLLWFAKLNYLPVLRFAQEHQIGTETIHKLNEVFESFLLALNPGWPVEVCGFVNLGDRNDETRVLGPLASAEKVASDSLKFLHAFCEKVATGKIEGSYEMLSPEMRANRSLRAYTNIFERAAETYKGRPVGYSLAHLSIIFTGPHQFGEKFTPKWPKYVQREHRRALVNVFWQTIPDKDWGCHGFLGLTENAGTYGLSKIEFYTP